MHLAPKPHKCAIVLAVVKDKPSVALRAILDSRCARRLSDRAAGTGEWGSAGPN
jgi:hypothetical protein